MTNAGKTFTISGNDENPGLLPRALNHVFVGIGAAERAAPHASSSSAAAAAKAPALGSFAVLVSYLEIYNENCYDLLGGATIVGATRPVLPLKDGR